MKKEGLKHLMMIIIGVLGISMLSFGQAHVRFVNNSNISGNYTGLTWESAYKYLQDALLEAENNTSITEIRVADGVYYPDRAISNSIITGSREASFNMRSNLKIHGGYIGEGANSDFRDVEFYPSVLSGDIGVLNDSTDNSFHVLIVANIENPILDGFIVRGGVANEWSNGYGGGMLIIDSNIEIQSCIFESNNSIHGGGALNINGSDVSIDSCSFISNYARSIGGALVYYNGEICITNSIFTNNISGEEALSNWVGANQQNNYSNSNAGGAIVANGHSNIENCIFNDNKSGAGGAIYSGSEIDVINCDFNNNSAVYGGAIDLFCSVGNASIQNCNFTNNDAINDGGAFHSYQRPNEFQTKLQNCNFTGNEAAKGGGIYCSPSNLLLVNNIMFNNTALIRGGAIYYSEMYYLDESRNLNIVNNIFFNNSAPEGAGIALADGHPTNPFEDVKIVNSILWDLGTSEVYSQNNLTITIGYSCVKGGYEGIDNTAQEPLFFDALEGDLRLRTNSVLINAGYNDAPNTPLYDIVGNPRIQDGTIDLGAYESKSVIYVKIDATGANSGVSWADAFINLQSALSIATSDNEVWVASGVYKPSESNSKSFRLKLNDYLSIDLNETNIKGIEPEKPTSNSSIFYEFTIYEGVTIYGGFKGLLSETSISDRDWIGNETILSGNVGSQYSNDDNCQWIVSGGGDNFLIDGFTISETNSNSFGTGIHIDHKTGVITNCKFENNSRGIGNKYGSVHVNNSIFYNNKIGIFSYYDMLTSINECQFTFNESSVASWYYCHINVTNSNFENNTCLVTNSSSSISVHDNSLLFVENCKFNQNYSINGSAIYSNLSIIDVKNSIFSNNSSRDAGSVFLFTDKADVSFCTFYNNQSTTSNYNTIYSSSNSNCNISNSIFWNPNGTNHFNPLNVNISYSDINDWTNNANGNFSDDPLFVCTDVSNEDFHLLSQRQYYTNSGQWLTNSNSCSPCIDAGNSSLVSVEPDGGQ